ncbi:MAG: caspase family protein, partial [Chitinophagaceae bacterium]
MAVDTNSINHKKTYAVLIGCSEYNYGLNAILPVKGNLEDMRSLLMDKSYIGLPPENVFTSFNETSDSIKDLLFTTSRHEMDTLIIYYAGHGLRTGAKELCLAAINSKKLSDTEWLGIVEYGFIKRTILEQCNARQKILLIDACQSGLAVQSADDDIFKAGGAYVLASSQAGDESYFNPLERNTCFTGTILD